MADFADGETLTATKLNALRDSAAQAAPPGTIVAFGGSTIPTGWLLCDGSPVSRATYAALFQAIGTAHGLGDTTTTFNLPDYRGTFLRGQDRGRGKDPGWDRRPERIPLGCEIGAHSVACWRGSRARVADYATSAALSIVNDFGAGRVVGQEVSSQPGSREMSARHAGLSESPRRGAPRARGERPRLRDSGMASTHRVRGRLASARGVVPRRFSGPRARSVETQESLSRVLRATCRFLCCASR